MSQIYEGWRNNLLPPKELKKTIKDTSKERLTICEGCEYHSANRKNYKTIQAKRVENENQFKPKSSYTVKWEIDTTKVTPIPFMGYEGTYKKSDVTSGNRLYYDRKLPFTKYIPFKGDYKSVKEVIIPNAYVIQQGQWPVIDLLKANKLEYKQYPRCDIAILAFPNHYLYISIT